MRALAWLATVGLTLLTTPSWSANSRPLFVAVPADRSAQLVRYTSQLDSGLPFGGYYRTVPLVRYVPWLQVDPPFGGYRRSAPWTVRSRNVQRVRTRR
jgi:hypothetical protein